MIILCSQLTVLCPMLTDYQCIRKYFLSIEKNILII